jgi:solute carrier family 25 (adenine nucleotide translocator) protein 4/5/6/31
MGAIAAGGLAGMSSYPLVYPLDYARTRLSTDIAKKGQKKKYKGLFDCIIKSVKSDGISGVYKGYIIANVGIFVYRGAQFGAYDILK